MEPVPWVGRWKFLKCVGALLERPTLDDSTKSKPTDLHELDGWGFRHPQALRRDVACHGFDENPIPQEV
jgi:hypothetical protein